MKIFNSKIVKFFGLVFSSLFLASCGDNPSESVESFVQNAVDEAFVGGHLEGVKAEAQHNLSSMNSLSSSSSDSSSSDSLSSSSVETPALSSSSIRTDIVYDTVDVDDADTLPDFDWDEKPLSSSSSSLYDDCEDFEECSSSSSSSILSGNFIEFHFTLLEYKQLSAFYNESTPSGDLRDISFDFEFLDEASETIFSKKGEKFVSVSTDSLYKQDSTGAWLLNISREYTAPENTYYIQICPHIYVSRYDYSFGRCHIEQLKTSSPPKTYQEETEYWSLSWKMSAARVIQATIH